MNARRIVTAVAGVAVIVATAWIVKLMVAAGRPSVININNAYFDAGWMSKFLSFVVLIYMIYLGADIKRFSIMFLAAAQFILLVIVGIFGDATSPGASLIIDVLSSTMLLLALAGGFVAVFSALMFMKRAETEEEHETSVIPMMLEMSFISILVLSDNIMWFYLFWQAITLVSFFMENRGMHGQTQPYAIERLKVDLFGGTALAAGILACYKAKATFSIEELQGIQSAGGNAPVLTVGLGLMCLAALFRLAWFVARGMKTREKNASETVKFIYLSYMSVLSSIWLIIKLLTAPGGVFAVKVCILGAVFILLIVLVPTVYRKAYKSI